MSSPGIHVFMPISFWGNGPSESCYRICSHWPGQGQPVQVYTPAVCRPDPTGILSPLVPNIVPQRLRRRIAGDRHLGRWLQRSSESRGLRSVRPGDICYFWPGVDLRTMRTAKDRGARVVVEFINTHIAYAKRILDAECARIDAPPYAQITASVLDEEAERVSLADAIFAPGPFVGPSLVENGAGSKVLQASYGAYLPAGYPLPARRSSKGRPLRYLFVGWASVRKGVHTLIAAWEKCALPAELVIVGQPEPYIMDKYLNKAHSSISYFGFSNEIDRFYREADVFIFPSIEEGGPQVTYEAAAHGLPLIVTPMGGGWIAAHRRNSLVVPPSDADALAGAILELHSDEGLRRALGANAAADAANFEWPLVAGRRLAALQGLPG